MIAIKKISKKIFKEFNDSNFKYKDLINLDKKKRSLFYKKNKNIVNWSKKIKKQLKNKYPIMLFDMRNLKNELNIDKFRNFFIYFSCSLGNLLPQNSKNEKTVLIYNRGKSYSMKFGARYHQTNEGGQIHTDNVNILQSWDFLGIACISQAQLGGDLLVIDGNKVYFFLKKNYPNQLKILKENFYWEERGLSNKIFRAPIIKKNNNKINFRYLRVYLVSAHNKAKKRLRKSQIHALDILDSVLYDPKFQLKTKLKKYQILITMDSRILHGRIAFKDKSKAVDLNTYYLKNKKNIIKRTMERVWIKN